MVKIFFFFFSSRRRHTRLTCDWSSDVCSSDLRMAAAAPASMAILKPAIGELVLRLYVAGGAPNSLRAIANTKAICDEHFAAGYELEIVDMLEHPQRALIDGIVV